MRTTLEIDDELMEAAKTLSRRKNQSLGQTVSELIRRGLTPEQSPVVEIRNGIPVWVHPPGAIPVTNELVRNLLEEE